MKKIISITTLILFSIVLFSQTEIRDLDEFSSLQAGNAIEVELTQGEINQAVVTTSKQEYLGKVYTEVKEGTLHIYTKGIIKGDVKVVLTFKNLEEINLSGASEIKTTKAIVTNRLKIIGSGATEASLEVETNSIIVDFSGASDITLWGNTQSFELKLSGASELKASELKAKKVVVNISGAADVRVYAEEEITGTVTGASSINVKGSPTVRTINKSGISASKYSDNEKTEIKVGNTKVLVDDDVDVQLGNKQVRVADRGDTTQVRWGNTSLLVVDDSVWIHKDTIKPRRNHWAGIDLGINGFLNSDKSLDLGNDPSLELTNPSKVTQFMELNYAKSWSVSLNFMEFFFKIKEHHFGFVTGMGTEWNNYELKHNIRLNANGGNHVYANVNEFNKGYTWGEVDTTLNYSKNRFKTWFVNVPLLLEYNSGNNKNKSFHISTGAILGLNLQTKIKYMYNLNGKNKKDKDKQSFNTNPFRVGLTARIGYGRFTMFATYSVTPLFENGRGPELYPFSVGVSVLPF